MQRLLGRLFPNSEFGPAWYRQGDFITFKTRGFAGGYIPEVLARTFYEVGCIEKAFRLLPASSHPTRSLEIGCGYGRLSPYVASHVDESQAVDVNRDALEEARRLYPQVKFSEASATALPFEDRYFDAIVSWTVLQHVPPDQIDVAISELNRVAKDSALIVLCEATLHGESAQPEHAHTHDRTPEFYAKGFSGRPVLASSMIEEIDRIENMASPGRLMVFGPLAA